MHNGSVAGFPRVKRALLASLSGEAFGQIEGSTDSEHVFAMFMDEYWAAPEQSPVDRMAEALKRTIQKVVELTRRAGITEPSHLNVAVSDGNRAVVPRFASGGQALAPSLYFHFGKRYVCEGGKCRMVSPDEAGRAILVCSEPLSDDPGWLPVPNNSLIVVREDRTVEVRPCPRASLVCVG
jgi:predicted glutamine amidotransferase